MGDSREAVAGHAGFTLETLTGRWVEMRHEPCNKTVTFVNPEPRRVRWYTDSHRCEPRRGWQGE